jgi:hypothetical protein
MRLTCLFLLTVAISGLPLLADGLPDLSAERPGFTTPSAPVGLGILQLEQGYTYEWARLGGAKLGTLSGPQAVVRFGLTKSLEVRFASNGYEWQTSRMQGQRTSVSGGSDYVVGAKLRVLKQSEGGFRPEISVIGSITLPAKGSPYTSSAHDPYVTLAADKDLPKSFSVIANANFASVSDVQGRIYSSGEGLWLTRSMKPVSFFAEVFHTTVGRGLGSEVVADLGCYKGLGKHMQVDFEAGHSVAGERPSMYASVGLVIRAPKALIGPGRFMGPGSGN